jgi:hypothetical protein
MILTEVDAGLLKQMTADIPSETEDELRFCKGNYVGVVRRSESQYEFVVRDMRREGPTIYGSRVDFNHATNAVTQLLDALMHEL